MFLSAWHFMDHEEFGKLWNRNADSWTKLLRAGCDVYRDYVNTPCFLSFWLNLLITTGFTIEHVQQPYAEDEAIRAHPELADSRIIAYFLHLRCRKNH
jgi:hypothetical protein